MVRSRQPVAVGEARVGQTELLRALVHASDERLFAPIEVLGHGDAGVVGRSDGDALHEVPHGHRLTGFEKDLRSAHAGGSLARLDAIGPLQLAAVDRLKNEKERHDLRDARHGQALVGVFRVEHLPGRKIHQDRGPRLFGEIDARGRRRLRRAGVRRLANLNDPGRRGRAGDLGRGARRDETQGAEAEPEGARMPLHPATSSLGVHRIEIGVSVCKTKRHYASDAT